MVPQPLPTRFSTDKSDVNFFPRNLYPGDIDGIDAVELIDAVLGLQVVSNSQAANTMIRPAYPESGADANGDDTIGIEDVLSILRDVSNP